MSDDDTHDPSSTHGGREPHLPSQSQSAPSSESGSRAPRPSIPPRLPMPESFPIDPFEAEERLSGELFEEEELGGLHGLELIATDDALDSVTPLPDAKVHPLFDSEAGARGAADPAEPGEPLSGINPHPGSTLAATPSVAWALEPVGSLATGLNLGSNAPEWRRRAEALERRAEASDEPRAKATTLLVASELRAGLGDLPRALELAEAACQLLPGFGAARRQIRQLCLLMGDAAGAVRELDAESKLAPSPEARAHALHLSGLIYETRLHDQDQAIQKRREAATSLPSDARTSVDALITDLANSGQSSQNYSVASTGSPQLAAAVRSLRLLRGAAGTTDPSPKPALLDALLALAEAETLLGQQRVSEAAELLLRLRSVSELEEPVLWLAQALLAKSDATRPLALECARQLSVTEKTLGPHAWLLRALEARDGVALDQAVSRASVDAASRAFLTLLLTPKATASLTPAAAPPAMPASPSETNSDEPQHPLQALNRPDWLLSSQFEGGEGATIRLGALLAQGVASTALREPFQAAHAALAPQLARAFEADFAAEAGNVDLLCQALEAWPEAAHVDGYFGGVLHEALDQPDRARERYARGWAASAFPRAQGLRVLELSEGPEKQAWLVQLADHAESPQAAALWLCELAAIRLHQDRQDGATATEEALRQAHAHDPGLLLTYYLGEAFEQRLVQAPSSTARLILDWRALLCERRQQGPLHTVSLLRAAIAGGRDEREQQALVARALDAQPHSLAINWLRESHAPLDFGTRGAWRESAAQVLQDQAWRNVLLLQAALDFEESGEIALAQHPLRELDQRALSPVGLCLARRFFAELEPESKAKSLLAEINATTDARGALAELRELAASCEGHADTLPWWQLIADKDPSDWHALYRLEANLMALGAVTPLAALQLRLAQRLPGRGALAAMFVGAHLQPDDAATDAAGIYLEWLRGRLALWTSDDASVERREPAAPLWALRLGATTARAHADHATLSTVEQLLANCASSPLDAATHMLASATALQRIGQPASAIRALQQALKVVPGHPVALDRLAHAELSLDQREAAAKTLLILADHSRLPAHAARALNEAARLHVALDHAEQAIEILERAVRTDPDDDEAFARLHALYLQEGKQHAAYTLAENRLQHLPAHAEEDLEVSQARALAEFGDRDRAKAMLSATLEVNPEHFDALRTFADLCLGQSDWRSAEQALIRLAGNAPNPPQAALAYAQLAGIYLEQLMNPARAKVCLREVLKRDPGDASARRKLIALYVEAGQVTDAVKLQRDAVERAPDAAQSPEQWAELARLLEEVALDGVAAKEVLDQARQRWPFAPALLRRWIQLYQRSGQSEAKARLIERTLSEALALLEPCPWDPDAYAALAELYRLRGQPIGAAFVQGLCALVHGDEPSSPPTARWVAQDLAHGGPPDLEDALAPPGIDRSFRDSLRRDSKRLEQSFGSARLEGQSVPPTHPLSVRVRQLSQGLGCADSLQLVVAPFETTSAGRPLADALACDPPSLVVSVELLTRVEAAREPDEALALQAIDFLLLRALKSLDLGAPALLRLSLSQLSTTLGEWLPAPSSPTPRGESDSRGPRGSQVALDLRHLCNRTALYLLRNPAAAAIGLRWSAGLPEGQSCRTSMSQDAQLRDLLTFAASPNFVALLEQRPSAVPEDSSYSGPHCAL